MELIRKRKLKGKSTIEIKIIAMVIHFTVFANDLAISQVDNVSTNLGFESFLGFGNKT